MSSVAWLLSAGFGLLMLLGVPFAFAIGIVVAISLLVAGIEPLLMPQSLLAGTQSFSLLAIPFFMLAGELMSAGGLSARLIKVADVFVRHLTGGLGHVTVLAAAIFAAISGSAPATTAAIGATTILTSGRITATRGDGVQANSTAGAIDVSAFILADGRRISVLEDWYAGSREERHFLSVVHQSACKRFGTVLGPSYNAAHRDHFHVELSGSGFCR